MSAQHSSKNNYTSFNNMKIDEALQKLEELKEWLMRNLNKETLIEDKHTESIRAIERATSYIKWARATLKSKAKQSYTKSYNKSYKKPYRKYYRGSKRWRKRY